MTNKNSSRSVTWSAVAALALGLAANSASALDYSAMYVFGDSLSDSGNIFAATSGTPNWAPLAPYFDGRFSNGPVWVEALADQLSLSALPSVTGGTNYAWGGARAGGGVGFPPTLGSQAGIFLGDVGGVADSDALYVVWGGGNDVLANESANAADDLVATISTLADAGARNFLVPNLPDIGQTPGALGDGTSALMTQLTLDHNQALADGLAELSLLSPELNIVSFDVYAIFQALLADPGSFGISNVDETCWTGDLFGNGTACANPDEYAFWDDIHPTGYTHAVLADEAYAALAPIPVPAALPLLLSALGMMGFTARRRRAA